MQMSYERDRELSVISVRSSNSRRHVSAKQARKRKKRKKKARICARLAVLISICAVVLIVGISIISLGIQAIGGLMSGNDADKANAGVSGNKQNIVSDSDNDNGNGTDVGVSDEPAGQEPSGGHIAPTEPDEPVSMYGDDLYIDEEFVVCIDPGHGSNDVGCVGVDGSYEKDDVLKLALYVSHQLEQQGVKVIMTRSTDVWVNLEDRPAFANYNNADVLVSLHRNTYDGDDSVEGFEAWINSTDSDNAGELAGLIMSGLEQVGISKNRGIKKGSQGSSSEDYAVNIGSSMPSVLLEMGFMSSPKDNQLFHNNIEAYAQAIADAIIRWSQGKQY